MKIQEAISKANQLLQESHIDCVYIDYKDRIFFQINKDKRLKCLLSGSDRKYLNVLLMDSSSWKVWHLR